MRWFSPSSEPTCDTIIDCSFLRNSRTAIGASEASSDIDVEGNAGDADVFAGRDSFDGGYSSSPRTTVGASEASGIDAEEKRETVDRELPADELEATLAEPNSAVLVDDYPTWKLNSAGVIEIDIDQTERVRCHDISCIFINWRLALGLRDVVRLTLLWHLSPVIGCRQFYRCS
jgi:hypothetical protein